MIDGVWESTEGFMCSIRSIPAGYAAVFVGDGTVETEYKISGVVHRVTTDGKIYPGYILDGIDNRVFKAEEIRITRVCRNE